MDTMTMAQQDEFLKPLLDMISGRMDRLENKVDNNTTLTQKVADEVAQIAPVVISHTDDLATLKEDVKIAQRKQGRKLDLPPNVVYLIALGAVVLLLIIAELLHINIGGIVK